MSENFQQTVDLREKMERQKQLARNRMAPPANRQPNRPTELEQIYGQDNDALKQAEVKEELSKIDKPIAKKVNYSIVRLAVLAMAVIMVALAVYLMLFRQKSTGSEVKLAKERDWYAVKLVNGEMFYGQIANTAADPVVMINVYYDYDQAKQGADKTAVKQIEPAGNIRLVKRGKETYGPDGSMSIVRTQVLLMEPMKPDSKVLKAILEYEK